MSRAALLGGVLVVIAATTACAATESAGSGGDRACTTLVRFGSFASGVDADAVAAVRAALAAQKPARTVTERRWGREGELDLCVSGAPVAQVMRTALPDRALRGYVTVLVDDRQVFTTQKPAD